MIDLSTALLLAHLIGLILGVGSATVKVILLFKSFSDKEFQTAFFKISKSVTPFIIAGLALMTLSGISWMVMGYPLTNKMIIKMVLVAAIWVLGPFIDNVSEPRFKKLVLAAGDSNAQALLMAKRQYLGLELTATGLFYAIILLWVLF